MSVWIAHACVGCVGVRVSRRCRGDREEHERGADGGRRREAALRGLLLPRVGAVRLRCGPAGLTAAATQRVHSWRQGMEVLLHGLEGRSPET